jgi:hypothetical protein
MDCMTRYSCLTRSFSSADDGEAGAVGADASGAADALTAASSSSAPRASAHRPPRRPPSGVAMQAGRAALVGVDMGGGRPLGLWDVPDKKKRETRRRGCDLDALSRSSVDAVQKH